MTQEELSRVVSPTYGDWTLDPSNMIDSKLISAQELLFLVGAFLLQLQNQQDLISSMDYLFYAIAGCLLLLIASSLLAGERLLRIKQRLGWIGTLGTFFQVMLVAVISSTFCGRQDSCPPVGSSDQKDLVSCLNCIRITDGSIPTILSGVQLAYWKTGTLSLLTLLGFENKPSHLIYSLIPLQVYIVSFPNSSQAEKITGYICLGGNVLTCLIKWYRIRFVKPTKPAIKQKPVKLRKIHQEPVDLESTSRKPIHEETHANHFNFERTWAPVIEGDPGQVMQRLDVIVNVPQYISPMKDAPMRLDLSPVSKLKKVNLRETNNGDLLSVSKHNFKKTDSYNAEPSQASASKNRKKMLTQGNHNIKMLWKEGMGNTDNASMFR